jgi:hypothetical protein
MKIILIRLAKIPEKNPLDTIFDLVIIQTANFASSRKHLSLAHSGVGALLKCGLAKDADGNPPEGYSAPCIQSGETLIFPEMAKAKDAPKWSK